MYTMLDWISPQPGSVPCNEVEGLEGAGFEVMASRFSVFWHVFETLHTYFHQSRLVCWLFGLSNHRFLNEAPEMLKAVLIRL